MSTTAATKSKAKKTVAAKKPLSHPSFFEMITDAIVSLKERTGSSQYAITKFIEGKQKELPPTFKKLVLIHLKKAVAAGKLVKVKSSFKLAPTQMALIKTTTTTAAAVTKKPKTVAKPTAKAATKPKPKAAAKPATKPKAKTAKAAPVKKAAAKPVKKAVAAKPVKKVAAKPAKKVAAKPVKKVVAKPAKKVPVKSVKKPKSVKSPAKKARK